MSTGSTTQTVVRRGAQAGDDARDRRAHVGAVVQHRERELEPVGRLPDGDPLVAERERLPARSRRACARRGRRAPSASRSARWRRRRAERRSDCRSATAPCRRSAARPRTKPQSVIPRSAASSTARLDGAPTATTTGQPATAAFWTSSKEIRPLRQRIASASGSRPSANAQPTTLSSALWRPTSSRRQRSSPSAVEEPRRVQAAGRLERGLRLAQAVGQARGQRGRDRQPALDAGRLDGDRLERALAADPARRRRVEAALQPLRVEPGRVHLDRVRGEVVRERGRPRARGPRRGRSRAPAPRRAPGVRIVTATGPAVDPDLERLLDREQVALALAAGSRSTSTEAVL